MLELSSSYSSLSDFAIDHGTLGWDNFLEGQVSKNLVALQVEYILCQAQSAGVLRCGARPIVFLHYIPDFGSK
jgi:hypothetical protein